MSKQPATDISGIPTPDLTSPIIRAGGVEQPFQPTKHRDYQAQAVEAREQAQAVGHTSPDWSCFRNPDTFMTSYVTIIIVLFIASLYPARKSLMSLCSTAMMPVRATSVFFIFLTIRGARKVSSVSASLWSEAKAADKKVTDAEHTALE